MPVLFLSNVKKCLNHEKYFFTGKHKIIYLLKNKSRKNQFFFSEKKENEEKPNFYPTIFPMKVMKKWSSYDVEILSL